MEDGVAANTPVFRFIKLFFPSINTEEMIREERAR